MGDQDASTDRLLDLAGAGNESAVEELMTMHRERLRRMVSMRMDRRISARVDASDVVQEALTEAARRLPEFARRPERLYYPWLRQIAWERLIALYRYHIGAQKRSVTCETRGEHSIADCSAEELTQRLAESGITPSGVVMRRELHERLQAALGDLGEPDREVLLLRHQEELSVKEVAALLGITEAAAQSRYRRALERLHLILKHDATEVGP